MILMVQPLAAGNALRIVLNPPAGTSRIRLLRKVGLGAFAGPGDPDALLIADGMDKAITDYSGLLNGEEVWYCAYYWISGVGWVDTAPKKSIPVASFEPVGPDVLSLVRERLQLGLKVFVDRGELQHERGFIPTLLASPQVEEAPLPLVTVHLANDSPDLRFVGEIIGNDQYDAETGDWRSFEGGYGKTDLTIVAWSLNSDERISLRNAIKAVLQANLPIFDAAGMLLVSWSFSDVEDYERYQVPMYQAVCQFSCYAPSAVEGVDPAIQDVSTTNVGYSING